MAVSLSRRAALAGAAALPLAGAATPLLAGAHGGRAAAPVAHSFKLAEMPVSTLLDASAQREEPKAIFGGNASDEEFAQLSQENFIADGTVQFYFTPALVGTGGELVLTAGLANPYVWSFARPDWELTFDMEKAADKLPMIGYHMPFPAAGFAEPRGEGFRYVPVSCQLMG